MIKFTINVKLVTIKSTKILAMVRNIAILYIKTKNCTDENLHAFKVVNVDWVTEKTICGC
jgi:hypothetical protein